MRKESLLSREELALLFPNLPDVIEIHSEPPPLSLPRRAGGTVPSLPSRFPLLVALQSLLNSGICQCPPPGCPSVANLCAACLKGRRRCRGPWQVSFQQPKLTSRFLASSPRFSLRIHEEAPGRRTNHQGNRGSHAVSGREGRLLGTSPSPGGWMDGGIEGALWSQGTGVDKLWESPGWGQGGEGQAWW